MKLRSAVLPCTLAVLSPSSARAQPPAPEPWFGPDKALHFTLSSVISGGGYGVTALVVDAIPARIVFGAGLAVSAGAAKELVDLAGFGTPSWKDFAWDVFGTAVGLGIAVTIDVATRRPRPVGAYGHPLSSPCESASVSLR
jgi:putative lipoprotein